METFLVCLASPVGIFLFNEFRHIILSLKGKEGDTGSTTRGTRALLVVVESVVLLFPMAICQTTLLYPLGASLVFLETILGSFLFFFRLRSDSLITKRSTGVGGMPSGKNGGEKLDFLTAYRSSVSYLTFVAILAVDFRVFPRRFAKTETVGYGLMDLGAGSFIVAGGLVSPSARNVGNLKQHVSTILLSSLTRSAPLVIIGFVRLATNKGIEYQEHSSEYGVHWNFFFTLALVCLLASVVRLNRGAGTLKQMIVSILLLLVYQFALTHNGLQDYIENASRHCLSSHYYWVFCDIFAANREGILGSVGYLAMFLSSESIGSYCLWSRRGEEKVRGIRLLLCSLVLWILHLVLVDLCGIPVSRRSTNSSFVAWTLAHNVSLLFLIWLAFYLARLSADVVKPSPIFYAVNRHSLVVFVLANLMTGLVNISTDTLAAGDREALLIIFGYLFSVGSVALLLDWVIPSKGRRHKMN